MACSLISMPWAWTFFSRTSRSSSSPSPQPRSSQEDPSSIHSRMALYSNGASDCIFRYPIFPRDAIFKTHLLEEIFNQVCLFLHFQEKGIVTVSRFDFAIGGINSGQFACLDDFS